MACGARPVKSIAGFLVGWLTWLVSPAAHAETTLPDGTTIPRNSGTEVQLFTLFADRGEAIDWITDGFPTPNTFSPLCSFKATFLLHQASSNLGVGWYNVIP